MQQAYSVLVRVVPHNQHISEQHMYFEASLILLLDTAACVAAVNTSV